VSTTPRARCWECLIANGLHTESITVDFDDVRRRSRQSLAATPRAFLRWAGSKRAVLPQLVELLPRTFRTYREPFLGGGSLFFLLQPQRAVITDSCAELIQTFEAVRDHPGRILQYIDPMKPDKRAFYAMRDQRSRGHIKRAAEFIYLNKTCWNGLYRVNAEGRFNVPYGAPKSDTIVDESNLRACSAALREPGVELAIAQFDSAMEGVAEGDLVFLDPPYVTRHNNNGFVDYNERLFSWEDQVKAAEVAMEAADAGAHVIVTNAYHDEVLDLYEGFDIQSLRRHSTLASASTARGPVREAILWKPSPLAR